MPLQSGSQTRLFPTQTVSWIREQVKAFMMRIAAMVGQLLVLALVGQVLVAAAPMRTTLEGV
jgi:hypothetical protein